MHTQYACGVWRVAAHRGSTHTSSDTPMAWRLAHAHREGKEVVVKEGKGTALGAMEGVVEALRKGA